MSEPTTASSDNEINEALALLLGYTRYQHDGERQLWAVPPEHLTTPGEFSEGYDVCELPDLFRDELAVVSAQQHLLRNDRSYWREYARWLVVLAGLNPATLPIEDALQVLLQSSRRMRALALVKLFVGKDLRSDPPVTADAMLDWLEKTHASTHHYAGGEWRVLVTKDKHPGRKIEVYNGSLRAAIGQAMREARCNPAPGSDTSHD